jgi:tetratricopeptide (TPR) repeat protein
MLMLVKRAVRYCWGINALWLLYAVFGRSTVHRGAEQTRSPEMTAVFLLAGTIFAVAWVANLKALRGEAFSMVCGLAASALLLVEGLATLLTAGAAFLQAALVPIALQILAGVAGIAAFAQKPKPPVATAAAPRARIAEDRTSRFTDKLIAGVAVLMQLAAMIFWATYAREHGIHRHAQVPYLVLGGAAAIFSAATHECGHAVAGWIFDMKLLSFNAGPFTWRKTLGKWNFTFCWRNLLCGGGAVNVVPTHPNQPNWHEVFVLLAGPLVNLWLGIGLAAVLLIPDAIDPEFRILFELMATYSVLAAIHNMMPFRLEEGAYSDGARILQVATNSPIVDLHRALLGIQATLVTKRRPRDYDIATIERAAALCPSEPRGVLLKLCGTHHYVDLGQHDKAAEWLAEAERMVEQHTIPLPAAMHPSFIIDNAVLHRDTEAVTRWFERMEKKAAEEKTPQRQGVDYWLAHASMLWMQGRIEEAKACLEKADQQAKLLPAVGTYDFDRSRCEHMQAVLHAPKENAEGPAQARHVEVEFASQGQEEWSYPASHGEASYQEVNYEPLRGRSFNFPGARSQEYQDATPFALETETQEETKDEAPYQPPFQWPSSLGRKFGSAQ